MKTKRQKIALAVCILLIIGTIVFLLLLAFLPGKTKEKTKWSDWVTAVAATCEEEGVQMRISLSDSSVYETRAIPAKGHAWGDWETVTEPTCLVAGHQIRTCANDPESHIDHQSIEPLGHDWGEWTTIKEPTCTEAGYEERVCSHDPDKHIDRRPLDALGHDWAEEYVVTTAPTCTEDGVETLYCRYDNEHTKTRTIAAYGHDWGGWIVTTAPTESVGGEETHYCRNDVSHTETRDVPAVGSEGCVYTLNEDETEYSVKITDAKSTTVYILAEYNGLPVTTLESNAFENLVIEKIVFLGDNLRTIETLAFASCESLQSVEIPASVTEVKERAFDGLTEEQRIVIKGFASEEEADAAWGAGWRSNCQATIIYEKD
ncbi:MAG: leucine-rich repeat domain-containing protein [Clostridia bacterium]|nr:leucine-rich repeat domain-containing protein [Clostridia bacterium]